MARRQYPSDHRRWFRVESAELAEETAYLSDAEFRALFLLRSVANEQKAHTRDDRITIAVSRLASVSPNRRDSGATAARVVRELCTKCAWELHENGATWTIHVRNWSKDQGFTPAELRRDSGETPAPTTTPTTTPNVSSSKQEETESEPAGEAPSAARPVKSKPVERFDPLNLARYGLDTLTVSTANDLLNVHPRGPRETPETLATWFAWIAPKMRLKGHRDLNRTARNWWPNLKREDVEKSREWLQVRCLSEALEARERRERVVPLGEIPIEDCEDLFREAGL